MPPASIQSRESVGNRAPNCGRTGLASIIPYKAARTHSAGANESANIAAAGKRNAGIQAWIATPAHSLSSPPHAGLRYIPSIKTLPAAKAESGNGRHKTSSKAAFALTVCPQAVPGNKGRIPPAARGFARQRHGFRKNFRKPQRQAQGSRRPLRPLFRR